MSDFTPPVEALAYAPQLPGEADLPEIWPDPLPVVVSALTRATTRDGFLASLPDIELIELGRQPAPQSFDAADIIRRDRDRDHIDVEW